MLQAGFVQQSSGLYSNLGRGIFFLYLSCTEITNTIGWWFEEYSEKFFKHRDLKNLPSELEFTRLPRMESRHGIVQRERVKRVPHPSTSSPTSLQIYIP